MVIYGSNFGNDTALVNVTIGGKKAVLINAKGNCLYCLVPQGAYSGVVKVSVGNIESGNFQTAEMAIRYRQHGMNCAPMDHLLRAGSLSPILFSCTLQTAVD